MRDEAMSIAAPIFLDFARLWKSLGVAISPRNKNIIAIGARIRIRLDSRERLCLPQAQTLGEQITLAADLRIRRNHLHQSPGQLLPAILLEFDFHSPNPLLMALALRISASGVFCVFLTNPFRM